MPARVARNSITSPIFRAKGQKSYFYPHEKLSPGDCEILTNINIDEQGVTTKRNGYTLFNTAQIASAPALTGLIEEKFTDGTILRIEQAASAIYTDDGTTRTAVTGTAETANDKDQRVRHAFIDNTIFGTDGNSRPWTKGSSGNAAVMAASIAFAQASGDYAKDFVVHQNLLIALNTKENGTLFPTRVRWCDIDERTFVIDPTVFPDSNRFEVYDEGPAIVGGTDNFGRLLVFKEDGLYPCTMEMIVGCIELRLLRDQMYRGFSPVARSSIISRPEFSWCVAKDGAYIIVPSGDQLQVQLVTRDVQKEWNDLNQARIKDAVSWVREKDHQVRTLLPASGTTSGHDRIMVYDWETGAVFFDEPNDAINFASSFRIYDVEHDFLGSTDGYVYTGNNGSQDNSNDINWTIKYTPNDLGMPGKSKDFKFIKIHYRNTAGSQAVLLTLILDEGKSASRTNAFTFGTNMTWDSGLKWDDGLMWPSADNSVDSFFINRVAETVSAQFTGSDSFQLTGIQFEYVPLEQ